MRRRWYLYLPIFAIWGLAMPASSSMRRRACRVLFNWTPSLPYRIAWLERDPTLRRGDFIVFSFAVRRRRRYRGCAASPSSRSCGLAGDVVTVAGRHVAINGEEVGVAKSRPTTIVRWTDLPTVIPPGHYYVQGTSPDSFDSALPGQRAWYGPSRWSVSWFRCTARRAMTKALLLLALLGLDPARPPGPVQSGPRADPWDADDEGWMTYRWPTISACGKSPRRRGGGQGLSRRLRAALRPGTHRDRVAPSDVGR